MRKLCLNEIKWLTQSQSVSEWQRRAWNPGLWISLWCSFTLHNTVCVSDDDDGGGNESANCWHLLSACHVLGTLLNAVHGHAHLTSDTPENVHVMRPAPGTVPGTHSSCSNVCWMNGRTTQGGRHCYPILQTRKQRHSGMNNFPKVSQLVNGRGKFQTQPDLSAHLLTISLY